MADKAEVRVVGLDRFRRTLDRARADVQNLEGATDETAALVGSEARRRAPKRTGRLAGSTLTGTGPNQVTVGSSVIYAAPIHWGWPARGIGPNRYVLDAAENTKPLWLRFWSKDAQGVLDKVKGA